MTLKWLHKKLSNVYSIVPLVMLVLFASFKSTSFVSTITNYTAKEMFTGIFFGSGALASNVTILQQFNIRNFTSDAKTISQVSNEQEQIYAKVNAQHPEYMAALKIAIGSGNHLRIESAIREGARYIGEAYSSLHPEVSSEMKESLAKDFASHVDVKNATPEELRQAINDYTDAGSGTGVFAKQACVVLLLLIAIAILLVVPLLAADDTQVEATLAKEMIVGALAKSGAK